MVNARALSPTFIPFINCYVRPLKWVNILELSDEFRDLEDPNAEDTNEREISETGSETETNKPPTIFYSDFEKSEKIWIGFQKRATEDADAVRLTLCAIHGGMSKSMQVQYSLHDTPASLWEELRHMKDPSNRRLDTSAADTYHGLSISENQTIPDYLKLICYVDLGINAQKTVRLHLGHRFAQAMIVLTITVHENVLDLEKRMIVTLASKLPSNATNQLQLNPLQMSPLATLIVNANTMPAKNMTVTHAGDAVQVYI
ncbi:hypothetical protein HDU80_008107 [Chytriomyces hyalinus]|nr:hypothetical protein HDU80_008107 [Chytriomyces hyalinus]